MSQRIALRQVFDGIKERWWIPLLLGILGAGLGVVANLNVPVVYRADATVLVGPTNGTVTKASTVRASENLAGFYADMARRQIVLEKVVDRLDLPGDWTDLRARVGAIVPQSNLRLVSIRATGATQEEAIAVADAVAQELAALSPQPVGSSQAFVDGQLANLQLNIESAEEAIAELKGRLSRAQTAEEEDDLRRQLRGQQELLSSWQRTYVDLVSAEPPGANAGTLLVIDDASGTTEKSRSGTIQTGVAIGAIGAVFGLLLAYLLHRRATRRLLQRLAEYHATTAAPSRPTVGAGMGGTKEGVR